MHVPGKAQAGEAVGEIAAEDARARDPLELLVGEAQSFDEIERLLESRRHEEIALGRQLAREELEHRGLGHAALEVRLQHGELVQIGEQGAGQRVHGATLAKGRAGELTHVNSAARAPSRLAPWN